VRPLPKVLWFVLALFALVNALEALRYPLPHVPFPVEMENFRERRMCRTSGACHFARLVPSARALG
jgi:hypothetical protein